MRRLAAAFALFGAFWGGWAVAAADVEHALGLSHGRFGLLLSLALAAAALTNTVGGALVERRGTASMLMFSLAAWAAVLTVGALVRPRLALGALLVVALAIGGLLDVVMNVAATAALANDPGKLVQFHARFNAGAAAGAAGTGLLLAQGASWRWQWAIVAALAAVLAALSVNRPLPGGAADEGASFMGALTLLRRERLLLIATVFAVAAMLEGGVELWGVLFLRTYLDSGLGVAVASATAGYLVATAARILIGPRAASRGAGPGVVAGGALAALGVAILAAAGTPWLSGAGLVLAAGGISLCWPLLLSYASAGQERPALVIGGVTGIGYLGFVLGPTLVGWVAAAFGLRWGLALLAGAGFFVALGPVLTRGRTRV